MAARGPGDAPPAVVRRRKARVNRQRRVQQQTANARPLSATPVKPKTVQRPPSAREVQRATQTARPLSRRPVKPQQVRPPRTAQPLASRPPQGVRAGKPVADAKQRRAVAVAAYNQLSGDAKRGHLAGARKRVQQGKPTDADVAILHHHEARVSGNRKREAAAKAFDALTEPPKGLARDPRVALATPAKPFKANVGSVADLRSLPGVITGLGAASAKGWKSVHAPKIIQNVPKDAAELLVTTPSSVAKVVDTAIHKPEKVPGMLVQPYKDLAKDPKKFITEHPVSSVLMVAPGARLPGRVAGRAARVTGKQTLARPAATLPGTALREARTGSKGLVTRAVQARADRRRPAPTVTQKQIHQRVDAAYAASTKHGERIAAEVMRKTKEHVKELPKAERKAQIEEYRPVAREAAKATTVQRFAREFGATARHDGKRVVEQPRATEGVLHDTKAQADAVAEHLNAKEQTIKRGGSRALYAHEDVPLKYVARSAGSKFMVIPEAAATRLHKHEVVGTSQATGAKVLRQSRRLFTGAVLPYRPTWLTGQAIEGAVRSTIKQAGPTSFWRAKKIVKEMERQQPGSGKAFVDRAIPGGLIGRTASREMSHKTFEQEFPDSTIARRLTDVGKTPGIKQVRDLHHAITGFVFNKVNGVGLEGVPQTAMIGKILKDSPLMERRTAGLFGKAIEDAARGLRATENQVAAVNELHKSYGKYSGFSPKVREGIMHWTPFLPWYINTARFMLSTLPKDHPVSAALLADVSAATEEWRKQQGLSLRGGARKPNFMLGGYPIKGGSELVRIGHYTPAGVGAEPATAAGGLPLPQFAGLYNALATGTDWKGDPLKHPDGRKYSEGEKVIYGLMQLGEAMVPLAGQASAIFGTGLEAPTEKDKLKALKKQFRPISTTKVRGDKPTKPSDLLKPPVELDLPGLELTDEQRKLLAGG